MAKTRKKYITVHTYRGIVDRVTGLPAGYGVIISDYEEGRSTRVIVRHRKRRKK
jgi:hypothetical protein